MKKLMFAAAALTAGFAMADGVVSSDIVGYAQSGLQEGSTLVTPQFMGLTSDSSMDLQSIKCNNEDSDQVVLMTLDSVGATVDSYYWINWGGDNGDEECWVDGSYTKVEGVTFQPGQAFWVQGQSTDNSFISAGKVGTQDVAVQLQEGATICGNFTPVSIDLQDIVCRNEDSDQVVLMTLDSVGATVDSYYWINWGGDNGDEECWVDGSYTKVEGVTFQPGQAFWVQGQSTDNLITFPGVEL